MKVKCVSAIFAGNPLIQQPLNSSILQSLYPPVFHQKIYFSDKPLVLTTDATAYRNAHAGASSYTLLKGATPRHFKMAADLLSGGATTGVLLEDASEQTLLSGLHKQHKPLDAAGGVVRNEEGEILFIHRRGKWDLPKGKRDAGEEMAVCAVREVQEETGIRRIILGDFLCHTYHHYLQGGKSLVKRTAWYAMRGSHTETLQPQAEEDITEVRWIAAKEVPALVVKTYSALLDVLQCAGVTDLMVGD